MKKLSLPFLIIIILIASFIGLSFYMSSKKQADDTYTSAKERIVRLYYYNPSLDEDESGNIMCSENGLVGVDRNIPITETPIQDTIQLLIKGELTPEEKLSGITTEYPLEGLEFTGASLENGTLTLGFKDSKNLTSGGSCRASILWLQIKKTATQFDNVKEVIFQPEDLFQP